LHSRMRRAAFTPAPFASGGSEFRDLSAEEAGLLRTAADGPRPPPVSAFDPVLVQQLYKKGLVYLGIPIGPDDRFDIPPLEVRLPMSPAPA
jgi:hypothetical protein